MQDNRPAVYTEGQHVIYRASAIGHCLRQLWAARNNMDRQPIPKAIQQGMDEGTNLEPVILNLLYEKHGFSFSPDYQGQQFQVELNLGAWNGWTMIVRGKVDEVGYQPGIQNLVLPIDVKAFTEIDVERYRTKGILVFPRYAWQQSVYGHALGVDHFYMPIFHKGTWEVMPWSLAPVPVPFTVEQIRDRVLQVEEAFHDNKMPETCPADYACPYPYLHEQKPIDNLPDNMVQMVQARIKLSNRITTLDQARKAIDETLKSKLTQDVAYHLDGYTISVFANPKRFNTQAAKNLLTEANVDWENDADFWTEGSGVQVRFTPPKPKATP
jgi:hypothetical protein